MLLNCNVFLLKKHPPKWTPSEGFPTNTPGGGVLYTYVFCRGLLFCVLRVRPQVFSGFVSPAMFYSDPVLVSPKTRENWGATTDGHLGSGEIFLKCLSTGIPPHCCGSSLSPLNHFYLAVHFRCLKPSLWVWPPCWPPSPPRILKFIF